MEKNFYENISATTNEQINFPDLEGKNDLPALREYLKGYISNYLESKKGIFTSLNTKNARRFIKLTIGLTLATMLINKSSQDIPTQDKLEAVIVSPDDRKGDEVPDNAIIMPPVEDFNDIVQEKLAEMEQENASSPEGGEPNLEDSQDMIDAEAGEESDSSNVGEEEKAKIAELETDIADMMSADATENSNASPLLAHVESGSAQAGDSPENQSAAEEETQQEVVEQVDQSAISKMNTAAKNFAEGLRILQKNSLVNDIRDNYSQLVNYIQGSQKVISMNGGENYQELMKIFKSGMDSFDGATREVAKQSLLDMLNIVKDTDKMEIPTKLEEWAASDNPGIASKQ